MKHRVEAVYWLDAQIDNESGDKDFDDPTLAQLPPVLSVGFLVQETPQAIVLAVEIYPGRKCRTTITIPKGMIRKRRRLLSVEWT